VHLGFLVSFVVIDVSSPGKCCNLKANWEIRTEKKFFRRLRKGFPRREEHLRSGSVFCDFQDVRSFDFSFERAEKGGKKTINCPESSPVRVGGFFRIHQTMLVFNFLKLKHNSCSEIENGLSLMAALLAVRL
jgi:hypothetical protein